MEERKMGTYYTLGVIKNIDANANRELTTEEWNAALRDRIDVDCFKLDYGENKLLGSLNEKVFEDNIADFYALFREILGKEGSRAFNFYEEEFGHKIENYQFDWTTIEITGKDGLKIRLHLHFALLFIEGKVMTEEFSVEPVLLNWLFRNSKIENKLAGCMISDITG